MTINPILNEISNFFTAVMSIYKQLPKDLNEEIKTMQAFLRSYDEKQLFLIQNFVRRIETKAQKMRYLNKRKNLKTQPDFSSLASQQENKQNQFNFMNVFNHNNSNIRIENFKVESKTSLNDEYNINTNKGFPRINSDGVQQDREMMKRYKDIFKHYSSRNGDNIENNHLSLQRQKSSLIERPLSIPKQNPFINNPGFESQQHIIKSKSSPYLQQSAEHEKVNCSTSSIESDFSKIELPRQFKLKEKNQDNTKEFQQQNHDKLMIMKQNALQLRKALQDNKDIISLTQLLDVTEF